MSALLNSQFVQVTLPVVVTLALGFIANNKRLDDMIERLTRIGEVR